ncbi:MAG: FecCD family ABC transporter permease [Pseudonocardia sp.]
MTADPPGTPAHRRVSRARFTLVLAGLLATTVIGVLLATSIGPVSVPLTDTARAVLHHLMPGTVGPPADAVASQIVWEFRLPRALLGAVVGASLALVGCALQAAVRNPLADPYLLGVSSGAALGAVAVIAFGGAALGGLSAPTAAFAGALLATGLVYVIARRRGRVSQLRLILSGVALAYLFQAAYSYLLIKTVPQAAQAAQFWLLGSLGSAGWADLGLPTAAVMVGCAVLLLQSRSLNALLVGDETAVSLGLDVHRLRVQLLVVTSLLVGVVVSVSGAIAFVGLVVPHVCRLVIGSDHRRLLPVAALTGASFLVLVDLAARTVDAPSELPLTIVTAVLGVPCFIWLLRRRERSRSDVLG